MPVPHRFRSAFSASTLRTLETHSARFRVKDAIFFRGAFTADVIENQKHFRPVLVTSNDRLASWRCLCQASIPPNDLCRHLALLLAHIVVGEEGMLPAQAYEQSVWRAIAFESFAAGMEIRGVGAADPREPLLRKYARTPQEQQLLQRGSPSQRLQFEESPWYRWSIEMFTAGIAADDRARPQVRVEFRDGSFHLRRGESPAIPLPPQAMDQVVTRAPEIVRDSGFEIAPQSLTPALRIEITRSRALRFSPVLLSNTGVLHERTALPQFGKYFLTGNRLASVAPGPPLFAEQLPGGQAALFEVRSSAGLPYDRETVLPEEEVFAFLERHRGELSHLPESLAPAEIRNAKAVRLEGEVTFDFLSAGLPPEVRQDGERGAAPAAFLEIFITFAAGDETITAAEIARARKERVRALIRGPLWIDIADPQFAWLDDATLGPRGQILVTRLELMRIRGSLRGSAVFRGDPKAEPVFRLLEPDREGGDAPSAATLGLDLYGYQQTGYQWLWLLQQNGFGGLLCDDMGLGKTHQAIALMAGMLHEDPSLSFLVVCPTSLMDHWKEKLAHYLPEGAARVTLTTYGLVRSRIEQYRGKRFDLVVLDEMQTIKNADTATHQALRAIDKRLAIGLTGTPIENHEGELKALLDFVVPGYLPKQVHDRASLQRLIRPFVLRRTKAQVLTQLPPKIVDRRFCELTSDQRLLYRRVLEARARPLRAELLSGARVSYVHIFAALNYLKQICNHPASAGGGFGADVSSGKWDMFVELLDECMSSGLKVVVFSQYLAMLDLIEKHLLVRDIGYASIRGGTRDRGGEIARFRDDPDCRVFTASLRAGGLGIDLTSASVVIHYDRWWNQAREDQATDRVHRLGQNKGVQVIKLIARNTIEEKIDALITRKAALTTELILDDDPTLVKQFTREELNELLSE